MDGWIKLHRKILDSSVFANEKMLKVWLWCLFKANWEDKKTMIGTREVELKRGQFIFGRKKASVELDIPPTTINRLMHRLADMKMIELKVDSKWTLVTVENYTKYQGDDSASGQIMDSKWTDNGQIMDSKWTDNGQIMDTAKNIKNIKNIKKEKEYKEREERKEKEKEKEKAEDGKNIPPTLDEINAWMDKKGYTFDGEQFFDFYESKGWMVGKNKMQNWHSAMSTWEKRERKAKPYKPKEDTADKINNVYKLAEEWVHEDDEARVYENSFSNTELLP